jgi:hypothetical protein
MILYIQNQERAFNDASHSNSIPSTEAKAQKMMDG